MRSHLPALQDGEQVDQTTTLHLGSWLHCQEPVPAFCRQATGDREGRGPQDSVASQAAVCNFARMCPGRPPRPGFLQSYVLQERGRGPGGSTDFHESSQVMPQPQVPRQTSSSQEPNQREETHAEVQNQSYILATDSSLDPTSVGPLG